MPSLTLSEPPALANAGSDERLGIDGDRRDFVSRFIAAASTGFGVATQRESQKQNASNPPCAAEGGTRVFRAGRAHGPPPNLRKSHFGKIRKGL